MQNEVVSLEDKKELARLMETLDELNAAPHLKLSAFIMLDNGKSLTVVKDWYSRLVTPEKERRDLCIEKVLELRKKYLDY